MSGVNTPIIGGESYQFITRHTLAEIPIAKATQYVYDYFSELHLAVEYQAWYDPGMDISGRNVVAEQPGSFTTKPCIYVVTAHVDSITAADNPSTPAPGADDDASGTAAVLMIAKALDPYRFGCTIRYVITTGEEQGLLGSYAYAQSAANAGDPISGVLALDMLAYKSNGIQKFELISRVGEPGIPDRLISSRVEEILAAYAIDLIAVNDQSNAEDADHASFWGAGFPAILIIQDTTNYNPFYHSEQDSLQNLNLVYFTKLVKASAGALAQLAGPLHQVYLPLTSKH